MDLKTPHKNPYYNPDFIKRPKKSYTITTHQNDLGSRVCRTPNLRKKKSSEI